MPEDLAPAPLLPKKFVRLVTIELASYDVDELDEIAGDMLEALKVLPEAVALPAGVELAGFAVIDPETDEEIVYDEDIEIDSDQDAGDRR